MVQPKRRRAGLLFTPLERPKRILVLVVDLRLPLVRDTPHSAALTPERQL